MTQTQLAAASVEDFVVVDDRPLREVAHEVLERWLAGDRLPA